MLAALRSLQNTVHRVEEQEAIQTFKISGGKRTGFKELLASHPDLENRIRRLEESR